MIIFINTIYSKNIEVEVIKNFKNFVRGFDFIDPDNILLDTYDGFFIFRENKFIIYKTKLYSNVF